MWQHTALGDRSQFEQLLFQARERCSNRLRSVGVRTVFWKDFAWPYAVLLPHRPAQSVRKAQVALTRTTS